MCIDNKVKMIPMQLILDNWHYIMFDISPDKTRVVVMRLRQIEFHKWTDELVIDETIDFGINDFNVDYFAINNMGVNVDMCNIRLYENEYPMEDLYL